MAAEMNETFMVRTSTPETVNDDSEFASEKLQTKLTQVQLKTSLSDVQNSPNQSTQRHQTPPMDLVVLPKTQADIVVNIPRSFSRQASIHSFQFPNVIDLNVGGCHYTTSLSTLRKYEDSMLAVMFSGRYDLVKDEDGHIFIDRDGTFFG